MLTLKKSILGLILWAAANALPGAATAEEAVKIGDLSKAGYACKEVGEARHLCTRGQTDPTYGCDKLECRPIGRTVGGGTLRAPVGALDAPAQNPQVLTPSAPQVRQLQALPRGARPGLPGAVAPGGSGVVLRTHCNGTCMCTGADCNEDWRKVCKDGPTCSSDPGGANLVCTCVKKTAD